MSKKLITAVLGTLFKMPDVEVAELLKTDDPEKFDEEKAIKLIIDKDKERIEAIKTESKNKFNDGYKKAQGEVLSTFEKKLKEKYGIEDELQGEELIDAILEAKTTDLRKKAGNNQLTEEEIKKLPSYLKLEKDLKKAVEDARAEGESKLKALQHEYSQKETFSKVRDAALAKFKAVGDVILPADAEKAQKMIQRLLIDELIDYDFQIDDRGKFLVLHKDGDKKGNRVEDDHGHALEFDDLISRIAKSNFDFKVADDRSNPGNGGKPKQQDPPGNTAKKYSGKAPANAKEYAEILLDASLDLETKSDFKAQYGKQFSE